MKTRYLWCFSALLLLAVGTALLGWLGWTESGLRFTVARVEAHWPELKLDHPSGSLHRGWRLQSLVYDGNDARVQAQQVRGRLAFWPLLLGHFQLSHLDASDLRLARGRGHPAAAVTAPGPLPNVQITALRIHRLHLAQLPPTWQHWQSLSSDFAMAGSRLQWRDLKLIGEQQQWIGELKLDLADPWWIALADLHYRHQGDGVSQVSARLQRGLAGHEQSFRLDLQQPLRAQLLLHPGKAFGRANAELSLPAQNAGVLGLPASAPLSAELKLGIDGADFQVSGSAQLGATAANIESAKWTWQNNGLAISALPLQMAGRGQVLVQGFLPVTSAGEFALIASTESLRWNAPGAAITQFSGSVRLDGPASALRITPDLQIDHAGLPSGGLSGALVWTPPATQMVDLRLQLERGSATMNGSLARGAASTADVRVVLKQLDPALLYPDWPGSLNGQFRWQGVLAAEGAVGSLSSEGLQGLLRGQPLNLHGRIRLERSALAGAELSATLGSARLEAHGEVAAGRSLQLSLHAPNLAEVHPSARGRLLIDLRQSDTVHAHVEGRALAWQGSTLERLDVDGQLDRGNDPLLTLDASVAALRIDQGDPLSGTAQIRGRQAQHRVQVQWHSPLGSFSAQAQGRLNYAAKQPTAWVGVIEQAALTLGQTPPLQLVAATAVHLSADDMTLDQHCWRAEPNTTLCGKLRWQNAQGELDFAATDLPLASLALLRPDLSIPSVTGNLAAQGQLRWSGNRLLSAQISLQAAQGQMQIPERPDLLLGFQQLQLQGQFADGHGNLDLHSALLPDGEIRAAFQLQQNAGEALHFDGDINLLVRDLSALEAYTTEIADPSGRVNGQLHLQGSLADWHASGALALVDFKAELPSLGLTLRDGALALAGVPEGLIVRGAVNTGTGSLTVDGRIAPGAIQSLALQIRGEQVQLVNIPALRIIANPNLQLERDADGWHLSGQIVVPSARILAEQLLPPQLQSADVVVIDDPPAETPLLDRWRAAVQVQLGDDVRVTGYGYDGTLTGRLAIEQSNRRSATASGQLDLAGKYAAYGQKLTITRGRLAYAASRLDEPSLDLLAERKVAETSVGLAITGTAQNPQSRVYSRPALSESEALALLVTGRPLGNVKNADRGRLSGAALALGSIGGDLLARNLGLDELGVGSDATLRSEAFTIGKFLSPRLYIGYGIALLTRGEVFTIRYRLSRHLDIEANASERNRLLLNYRIEH